MRAHVNIWKFCLKDTFNYTNKGNEQSECDVDSFRTGPLNLPLNLFPSCLLIEPLAYFRAHIEAKQFSKNSDEQDNLHFSKVITVLSCHRAFGYFYAHNHLDLSNFLCFIMYA